MFNITKKSMQWGEETLTLETGKVARQADGSVIATLGETSVMANVTFARQQKPGQDFFPLTVHYQEKYYAAGKLHGGFFKREAHPTEMETLTARLIDRPIRPLFVPGFKNEVLVMCPVLSHDLVNDPDIVAMIAASAALTISGAPFMGPIAGARVGFEDGDVGSMLGEEGANGFQAHGIFLPKRHQIRDATSAGAPKTTSRTGASCRKL